MLILHLLCPSSISRFSVLLSLLTSFMRYMLSRSLILSFLHLLSLSHYNFVFRSQAQLESLCSQRTINEQSFSFGGKMYGETFYVFREDQQGKDTMENNLPLSFTHFHDPSLFLSSSVHCFAFILPPFSTCLHPSLPLTFSLLPFFLLLLPSLHPITKPSSYSLFIDFTYPSHFISI